MSHSFTAPKLQKHHMVLMLATFVLAVFSPNNAQTPALTKKLNLDTLDKQDYVVTEEELQLAAKYEDKPLFLQKTANSRLHYPGGWQHARECTARGCTNGCTIGFGYNLGARSAREAKRDLRPIVGAKRANEFAAYAGKIGKAAYRACGRKSLDKSTLPTMSRDESWQLLAKSMVPHKRAVMKRIYDEKLQNSLSNHQVAVLVALDFQNPKLASRAKMIWHHMKRGEFNQVASEIKQNSGSQILSALQPRRDAEAKIFLSALQ